MPELSIIIVSYNVRQYLLDCLASVVATCRGIEHEIIAVDNASSDGSAQAVKEKYPQVKLVANKNNAGFAKANNQGYGISTGEYILLLNPDTLVKPGAVKTVLEFMKNTPDAGLAGCRLLNSDGTLQKSAKRLPTVAGNLAQAFFLDRLLFPENRSSFYYGQEPRRIGYPNGAFMMVRRSALGEMPLLNDDYFMYAEEKDLALKLKHMGYSTYFVPGGEIIHHGGKSTDQMALAMFLELQKSQVKFYKKYHNPLKAFMLNSSWWLVLLSNFILNIPLSLVGRYRSRLSLFKTAMIKYPQYMRTL